MHAGLPGCVLVMALASLSEHGSMIGIVVLTSDVLIFGLIREGAD